MAETPPEEMKNKILKVKPPPDYPPEEGHYLRGNDFSPVAVVVLLNAPREEGKIPAEVTNSVRIGIETGAALAGTLQTENIGVEKIIANVVANPNIRYLIVCGQEVEGHRSGEALIAFIQNGINERRIIIGTDALTPYLFNLPIGAIDRFRKQVEVINLINVTDPEEVKKAVKACYQEQPTEFRSLKLCDPGAYPEAPICTKITQKIEKPEAIEEWEIDEEFLKKLKD